MGMDKQHFAIDRKHNRIDTEIPCRIGLQGDCMYDATVLNLSVGGLKLVCNHATYTSIIPADQLIPGQVSDVRLTVKFSLSPISRRAMNLQLDGMVTHSERLAQDSYHIGIQFTGMLKTDINRLEDYIDGIIATRD
jgi:hypothetical protein